MRPEPEIENPELPHRQTGPTICDHFGCGKQLTRQEYLCGNNCVEHTGKIEILVKTKYTDYPLRKKRNVSRRNKIQPLKKFSTGVAKHSSAVF